ncbi:MAG: cation-translocating P-type ATPase, partial [Mycolicibacter algericus]
MPPSIAALIDDTEPELDSLYDALAAVESHPPDDEHDAVAEGDRPRSAPAPGDGLLAVSTAAMAGVAAVGLGISLAGRVLRFPRLPASVQGAVVALDHQPRLRRLLEERIGKRATDTALGLASTTANALALAPSMLAVDLAINTLKAAETRAVARAWSRREPAVADIAAQPAAESQPRTVPSPA